MNTLISTAVAIGSSGIDQTLWTSLRECQQRSIEKALLYVHTSLASTDNKSCLISLPTGAGKSGVISVLSHMAPQVKTLVVCHRRAVCDQLTKEIDGGFFSKTCPTAVVSKKNVFSSIDDTQLDGIYITTFQMLNKLGDVDRARIKNDFALIIIDEGHSEPSPVWRTLVRGTNAHKIVVTATPYRNDLFQFDISPTFSYIYSFSQALQQDVLTEPSFETISKAELGEKINQFLNDYPDSKCIIKCKTFAEVEEYFQLFDPHVSALAIHERYVNDVRSNVKTSVPKNLAGSSYKVIIHQHKLDEGVDIPEAKLLVLTYVLGSGRELVQTIGRIVRKYGNLQPVVMEFENPSNLSMWSSYRDFDLSLSSAEGARKFLASLDTARLIELYLEAFPDYSYHENKFVGKFDLNSFDPDNTLTIPTASVCFFQTDSSFAVRQTVDALYWRATNQGELCKIFNSRLTSIVIILSVAFRKSRFLRDELFFEPSLELTLIRPLGNSAVAIFDSRGRSFGLDQDLNIGATLDQEKLLKIMTRGASVRPKETSTRSISSARRRPEAMHIKAQNLDDLGGQQQFSAYRMSTIKCDTLDNVGKKSGSYYVGVDAGRISDHMDKNFSLQDLDEWLNMVETCLASTQEADSRVLKAFAKPISASTSLIPESIVLDFTDFESPIDMRVNGRDFSVENSFVYFVYPGRFNLDDGIPESGVLINILSEAPYIKVEAENNIEIISHLEYASIEELVFSSVHKIMFQNGVTYSAGKFFEFRLPTHAGFSVADSELSRVLFKRTELLDVQLSEKGHVGGTVQTSADEFHANSVFNLVDKLKNYCNPNSTISELGPFYQHIPSPDYMLCADMGTEPADFIIMSPEKIAYVHVKCGTSAVRPQSSAGALAEVGSQAIKNLEMLISHDQNLRAGNWTNLLSEWPEPSAPQKLSNRIRLYEGRRFDGAVEPVEPALERFWSVLAERRRSVGVRKEVWIIAANSFSIADFEVQMQMGANGRSESLQAYQLLQGWISAASNLDAEIKVFAAP